MNLPDDPWALLELDRTVAGEREVKRAYARLLKQYRPETDPQGFRRVHDAYQTALEELSRGPHPDADPVEAGALGQEEAGRLAPEPEAPSTVAEPDPAPVPRREVDPPILASFDGISENLLKRLGLVASSGDLPELTRLRNLVRQHPELAERWVEVLLKLVEGPAVQQVVSGMHAEDVWLLMREGQGQFAAGVMMQWRGTPAWLGRFNQLGNLLLEQSAGDHPDRLQAMHFTARMAAFYLPEVSGRLADELYRQAGPAPPPVGCSPNPNCP